MSAAEGRFAPEAPLAIDPIERDTIAEQVEISTKYAGYIERQKEEISKHANHETTRIPTHMDYMDVKGLSIEVKQRLQKGTPETIGQAARMQGITPAAISLLLVHIKRLGQAASKAAQASTEEGA